MSELIEIFTMPLLACLVLVGIHCYLGLHIISRGVIFVDLALAQLAAFGSSVSLLMGYELGSPYGYFFGLGFTLVGAVLFTFMRTRDDSIPQEAVIGITYAVASSATLLILSQAQHGYERIKTMLDGGVSLLTINSMGVVKILALYSVIGLVHFLFRKRFLLISTDLAGARRQGVKIWFWDLIFYMMFGFVVTSSVQVAGVLMVFAYLIIPAVCAMLFARSVAWRLVIGWFIGVFASVAGLLASYYVQIGETQGLPIGSSIVTVLGCVALLSVVARVLIRRKDVA